MNKPSTNKTNSTNSFIRILTVPFRALGKARDFYVRSLISCATRVGQGPVGCPGGEYPPLPRSFSVAGGGGGGSFSARLDDDDFRELVRAASARSYGFGPEKVTNTRGLPKSCSVGGKLMGMVRIEEERDGECDDSSHGGAKVDSTDAKKKTWRSRSFAGAAAGGGRNGL